jgi:transcriptional regulator with XRE-family HTH domain
MARKVTPELKELRRQRGLTVEAVAILAGVDQGTVSRLERGLVEARPETIVALARGLGIGAMTMRAILAEARSRRLAQIEAEALAQ